MQKITELKCKSALYYHKPLLPTHLDLNIYRGCEHKCIYCFAQYSHKYLESDNFFDEIFVKTNIAEQLDKELSKKHQGEPISISGVTDCYQPIERKYKLMPQILEVIKKHKNPIVITTKSNLILRDLELIKQIAQITDVCISSTITTLDENIQKLIEPNAAPTLERFEILQRFKEIDCHTTLMLMPVIPHLTDSQENLEAIFKTAKQHNVDYLITDFLNLKGHTKQQFLNFLQQHFPHLIEKYKQIYKTAFLEKNYKTETQQILNTLRKKYSLLSPPSIPSKKIQDKQMKLF